MTDEDYWGFSIRTERVPVPGLQPAGACVAAVTSGNREVFTLRVDVGLDLIRGEPFLVPAFSGDDHRGYLADTAEFVAERLVRGVVNLGAFRDDDVIERRWPPDSESRGAELSDTQLLRQVLTALQRRARAEALTQEIDLIGIAMVLEVRLERLREIIAEALVEGLVEPFGDTFGHTPSDGACRITAAGLQKLRELNERERAPAGSDGASAETDRDEAAGVRVPEPPPFNDIWLDPEQENLLCTLVEAARSLPRDKREKFVVQLRSEQPTVCIHPGLGGLVPILFPDLEALGYQGLVAITERTPGSQSGSRFVDVTPKGFRYYEHIHGRSEEPLRDLSSDVSRYLEASDFSAVYHDAYRLWREAESRLRAANSEAELTTIGHKCREAVQAFATILVDEFNPEEADADPTHTVARLRAVLKGLDGGPSAVPRSFLDALVSYWGEVSDLIQRQEHGAQKEGSSLAWEDGRRVVFHTAIVMYEVARTISRPGA